jgi:hypothetical protein
MFKKLRARITATAAGVACMVVSVVAAGFTVYTGFALVVPNVYASCLTALVFLVFSLILMVMLKDDDDGPSEAVRHPEGDPKRWAGLAGQLIAAFAAGALAVAQDRRRR